MDRQTLQKGFLMLWIEKHVKGEFYKINEIKYK